MNYNLNPNPIYKNPKEKKIKREGRGEGRKERRRNEMQARTLRPSAKGTRGDANRWSEKQRKKWGLNHES